MKVFTLIAVLAFAVLCMGCGTKGPLYLPKKGTATPNQPAPLPDPVVPPVPVPETPAD